LALLFNPDVGMVVDVTGMNRIAVAVIQRLGNMRCWAEGQAPMPHNLSTLQPAYLLRMETMAPAIKLAEHVALEGDPNAPQNACVVVHITLAESMAPRLGRLALQWEQQWAAQQAERDAKLAIASARRQAIADVQTARMQTLRSHTRPH